MSHKVVKDTPVIDTAIYAAGDTVGGLMEFEDARTPYARSGHLALAILKDNSKQNALMYLVLFDRTFTAATDQAAFAISDADMENAVAVLRFEVADYASFNANSMAMVGFDALEVHVPFELIEGGTSLFGQLYLGAGMTPTYAEANDITIELTIE